MNKVYQLKPCNTQVVEGLRKLADEIERGEAGCTSAIVVMQDRAGEMCNRITLGEQLNYSAWMGLLQFASHSLYAECENG